MKTLHDAQTERYTGAIESLLAQNKILVTALAELGVCDFNRINCDSLETATRRVQRVARAAIALAGEEARKAKR